MNAKEKLAEVRGYVKALYDIKSISLEKPRNELVISFLKTVQGELGCLLEVIDDFDEEEVISTDNNENKYRKALGDILKELRLIDEPNPADENINSAIDVIRETLEEEI